MAWINAIKNTATLVNQTISDILGYILTDSNDYVLLGQNEDEVLIFNEPTSWTNTTKN